MSKFPEFKVTLKEVKSPHFMETKPRYDILVNGVKRDFIYFNMTGYRGAIPMLGGGVFDPGEGGISRFRKAVREANREAAEILDAARQDQAVCVGVRQTEDPMTLLAYMEDKNTGESLPNTCVRRDAWEYAKIIFKDAPIPQSFLAKSEMREVSELDADTRGINPGDKVLHQCMTSSINLVMLMTGPAPDNKKTMRSIKPEEVEQFASGVVFMSHKAWQELKMQAGASLIDVSDLPLIDGGTLPVEHQPDPLTYGSDDWIKDWFALRNAPENTPEPDF
jgi:hypothetical protein